MKIGSTLAAAPVGTYNCNASHQCTVMPTSIAAPDLLPAGLSSPVNGTVIRFSVRNGPTTTPLSFRVLRPAGGTSFMGAGTSSPVTPLANQVTAFSVQMPIRIGDTIGVDCCEGGLNNIFRNVAGAGTRDTWGTLANQALADGQSRSRDSANVDSETLLQAEIQPDNGLTLGKAKRSGGKVKVDVTVPNAGYLSAVLLAPPGAKPKKACHFLCWTAVTASGPGTFELKIPLSARARSLLRTSNRVRTKVPVFYTPTFGTTRTERLQAKLKG